MWQNFFVIYARGGARGGAWGQRPRVGGVRGQAGGGGGATAAGLSLRVGGMPPPRRRRRPRVGPGCGRCARGVRWGCST